MLADLSDVMADLQALKKPLAAALFAEVGRHNMCDAIRAAFEGRGGRASSLLRLHVQGYYILHNAQAAQKRSLLLPALERCDVAPTDIAETILTNLMEACSNTAGPPKASDFHNQLMHLALALHVPSARLIECLSDPVQVGTTDDAVHGTTVGEVFYNHFSGGAERLIPKYLLRHQKELLPKLAKKANVPVIKQAIHDCLYEGATDDAGNVRKALFETMLGIMFTGDGVRDQLFPKVAYTTDGERDLDTLQLISKVLNLLGDADEQYLFNTVLDNEVFQRVLAMFWELLKKKGEGALSLTQKSTAVKLLPTIANLRRAAGEPYFVKDMNDALKSFAEDNFGVAALDRASRSGEADKQEYAAGLDTLLNAMVDSGLLELLSAVMVQVMCIEVLSDHNKQQHQYEDQIRAALYEFIARPGRDVQTILKTVFYLYANNAYPPVLTLALVRRVLVPFLLKVSQDDVEDFFDCNILAIISKITEIPSATGDEKALLETTQRQTGGLVLVDVMFSRLPQDKIKGEDSRVEMTYSKQNGVEPDNTLMKFLIKELEKNIGRGTPAAADEQKLVPAMRTQRVAAYSAVSELLKTSAAGDALKFGKLYGKYLMGINKSGVIITGAFFKNLVDQAPSYAFTRDTSEASVLIFDKNERPDIHRSELGLLNMSFVSELFPEPDARIGSAGSEKLLGYFQDTRAAASGDGWDQGVLLTAMLSWMDIFCDAEGQAGHTMPPFAKALLARFIASADDHNVRIFILKVLINRTAYIGRWAQPWFGPLLTFLLQRFEFFADAAITSLVVDCCLMFLQWEVPTDTAARTHGAALLRKMMERVGTGDAAVLTKNNAILVHLLLNKWADFVGEKAIMASYVGVATELIGLGGGQSNDENAASHGTYLLEAILASDVPLPAEFIQPLFRALTGFLATYKGKNKGPLITAAKCVGALQLPAENPDPRMVSSVTSAMQKLGSNQKGRSVANPNEVFLLCVYKMSINGNPQLSGLFVPNIESMLSQLPRAAKIVALRTMVICCSKLPDILKNVQRENLKSYLRHDDPDTQGAALEILHRSMSHIPVGEYVKWTLDCISVFQAHLSAPHRSAYFQYLFKLRGHLESNAENVPAGLTRRVEESILKAIADPEHTIRVSCLEFWDEHGGLGQEYVERMPAALNKVYSHATEPQFLQIISHLTVKAAARSPEFDSLLFDEPLGAGEWKKVEVDAVDLGQNAHMSSIYAESQRSADDGGGFAAPDAGFVVRATQASSQGSQDSQLSQMTQFTQTQTGFATQYGSGGGSVPMDMETQDQSQVTNNAEMLFARKNLTGSKSKRKRTALETTDKSSSHRSSGFMPDGGGGGGGGDAQRKKRARHSTVLPAVVMYRTYRKGELPDVQIKHSDLLKPLQALALHDAQFSEQLFSALFPALYHGSAATQGRDGLHSTLQMFFEPNSVNPSSGVVSAICAACAETQGLILDVHKVQQRTTVTSAFQAGIVLIEKQIAALTAGTAEDDGTDEFGSSQRSQKRQRTGAKEVMEPQTAVAWRQLAILYKALGDYDALNAIYKLPGLWTEEALGHIQHALDLEAVGKFADAKAHYKRADEPNAEVGHEEEVKAHTSDFLQDAMRECSLQLCEWPKLGGEMRAALGPQAMADLPEVSLKLRSNLHQYLELPSTDAGPNLAGTNLEQFIQRIKRDSALRSTAEENLAFELATYYSCRASNRPAEPGNIDLSQSYLTMAIDKWLKTWTTLHPLLRSARWSALRKLQGLVELKERLWFESSTIPKTQLSAAQQLLHRWRVRPAAADLAPMPDWDFATMGRESALTLIGAKCDSVVLKDSIARVRVETATRCAGQATARHAFDVGKLWLKRCKKPLTTDPKPTDVQALTLEYNHANGRLDLARLPDGPFQGDAVKTLCKTMNKMVLPYFSNAGKHADKKAFLDADRAAFCRHRLIEFSCLRRLVVGLADETGEQAYRALDRGDLAEALGLKADALPEDATACASMSAAKAYAAVNAAAMTSTGADGTTIPEVVQANIELAKFATTQLRGAKELRGIDEAELRRTLVTATFNAMGHGSIAACAQFPRVLQMVKLADSSSELQKLFVDRAAEVPCWMFIRWTSQMLPLLQSKKDLKLVKAILKRVAKDYPGVLTYPLMISEPQLDLTANKDAVKFMQELKRLIHIEDLEKFVGELEHLHEPHLIFSDYIGEGGVKDKAKTELMMDRLCPEGAARDQNVGSIRRAFAAKFGKAIKKCATAGKGTSALREDMANWFKTKKGMPKLEDYSPWLRGYQAADHARPIEVPGQYGLGASRPRPELHTHIDSFSEKVLVLTSMRKPKRIKIRASNSIVSAFLAKGGEDLRLDQRVQQIFGMVNEILEADPDCRRRNLSVRTYQCFPMTTRIGMIEWVENTKILQVFLTWS